MSEENITNEDIGLLVSVARAFIGQHGFSTRVIRSLRLSGMTDPQIARLRYLTGMTKGRRLAELERQATP